MDLFALVITGTVFGLCCLLGIFLCWAVHEARREHSKLMNPEKHKRQESYSEGGKRIRIRKITLTEAIHELFKRIRSRPLPWYSKDDSTECQSAVISLDSISLADFDQTMTEIQKAPKTSL